MVHDLTGQCSTRGNGTPDYASAIHYAMNRLERELPSWLTYHALAHTRDDVLLAAERLAAGEGIVGEPLHLLRVAAAFHDIGFVDGYADHEDIGIRIARERLPSFGFGADHVRTVTGMIRATKLPQTPTNTLEAILDDADLDSLGRADFFVISLALREELAARGDSIDEATWVHRQQLFLRNHRYWTATARRLRDQQKQHNTVLLGERLRQLDAS